MYIILIAIKLSTIDSKLHVSTYMYKEIDNDSDHK